MGGTKTKTVYKGAALAALALGMAAPAFAGRSHEKKDEANDPTYQLFQLIDSTRGGVLKNFYLLADVYTDTSGNEFRHVLRVDYDKNRGFGRLSLYVRSVGKMDPAQLATYKPEQIYDFGEIDQEKFMKTDPGPLGQTGDIFLVASKGEALHTAPVTPEIRKQYEDFITQYIIPALKAAPAQ